jgi:hypothetical protein
MVQVKVNGPAITPNQVIAGHRALFLAF